MALITLGSGIAGIRGKIGGTVYQGSASGTISKNRGIRTNKSSYQSDKAKSTLAMINHSWQNLTSAQRLVWNDFAIFKPTLQANRTGRFMSGQQIYMYWNFRNWYANAGLFNAPEFTIIPLIYPVISIRYDAPDLIIDSDVAIDETNFFLWFKISSSIPSSRANSVGGVKSIIPTFGNTQSATITSAYSTLFGRVPINGEFVVIETQIVASQYQLWTNISSQKVEVNI